MPRRTPQLSTAESAPQMIPLLAQRDASDCGAQAALHALVVALHPVEGQVVIAVVGQPPGPDLKRGLGPPYSSSVNAAEASRLLGVGETASPHDLRQAYLQRVQGVRLETDPDAFVSLRGAYELLTHWAESASEELAAARAEVAACPDSVPLRWRLLSCLPYHRGSAALAILQEGAQRNPEEFLDELLCHFPGQAPRELVDGARAGAGVGRLLLVADAHAVQGRPVQALEALRAALAMRQAPPGALVLRPVFSLHANGQVALAREAFALLAEGAPDLARDAKVGWPLRIAVELDRIDKALPADLRAVAANAAKLGDFETTPNEARFATERLRPRDVRKLSATLRATAPTLAQVFALDVPLRQYGPQDFRIPIAWGTIVLALIWNGARVWLRHRHYVQQSAVIDQVIKESLRSMIHKSVEDIQRACNDPDSAQCNEYRQLFSNGQSNAGQGSGRREQ
jgi:hypothetical protein